MSTKKTIPPVTKIKYTLTAQPRQTVGRKVKTLRRQNLTPANIYGKKIASQNIQVSTQEFQQIYQQAGETNIIDLKLKTDNSSHPVLVSNVHLDPVTDLPLHVDFHQIDLTEKVTATVSLELTGESPAQTDKDAIIVQLVNEIEVEALPADLPEKLMLDISKLKEIGDSLSVSDLQLSAKLSLKADPEQQLVQAQEPKEEEEPLPAPVDSTAPSGTEAEAPASDTTAQPTPDTKAPQAENN